MVYTDRRNKRGGEMGEKEGERGWAREREGERGRERGERERERWDGWFYLKCTWLTHVDNWFNDIADEYICIVMESV